MSKEMKSILILFSIAVVLFVIVTLFVSEFDLSNLQIHKGIHLR